MTPKSFILPFLFLFLFWFTFLSQVFPSSGDKNAPFSTPEILGESFKIELLGRNAQESAALKTQVKARVGRYRATISGFTSPYAQVFLSGFGLYRETTASKEGLFLFDQVLLPEKPTELCFQAQDLKTIPSSLLCLPKFLSNRDILIKDIYLPPTISLEKGQAPYNQTVAARGATTPNSPVALYLFEKEPPFYFSSFFVRKIFAKAGPRLEIKSNNFGFFEFNLPTAYPADFRFFVGSSFGQFVSPKSLTLTFKVFGFWEKIRIWFWGLLAFLWELLKTIGGNFSLILTFEGVILGVLLAKIFWPKIKIFTQN